MKLEIPVASRSFSSEKIPMATFAARLQGMLIRAQHASPNLDSSTSLESTIHNIPFQ